MKNSKKIFFPTPKVLQAAYGTPYGTNGIGIRRTISKRDSMFLVSKLMDRGKF
jgi:hypothetical protein